MKLKFYRWIFDTATKVAGWAMLKVDKYEAKLGR